MAFDTNRRTANIVAWNATDGNLDFVFDISQDVNGGFVFGGAVTYCASTRRLAVGVKMEIANGVFGACAPRPALRRRRRRRR